MQISEELDQAFEKSVISRDHRQQRLQEARDKEDIHQVDELEISHDSLTVSGDGE